MSANHPNPGTEGLPTAESISWEQAPGAWAANQRTHFLDSTKEEVLRLRPTNSMKRFGILFVVFGIAMFGAGLAILATVDNKDVRVLGYLLMVGWAVPVAGGVFCTRMKLPAIEFDLDSGCIRLPPIPLAGSLGEPTEERSLPLEDVFALQLLGVFHEPSEAEKKVEGRLPPVGYMSYQLNLVLQDADRVPLTNQSGEKGAKRDAMRIAEFLKVPLWIVPQVFTC